MPRITGLTAKTPENLLLDVGAFFLNYDVKTDTPKTAASKLIGATQGGGSFSAVPTTRRIEIDGVKGAAKGLETIDEWAVTMVSNVKEITAANLALALGAASISNETTPANYKKIIAKEDFEDADYAENITWIGNLKGNSLPIIIIMKNAISLNGLTLTVADKSEAVIPITLTGHYSLDDLETPPFEIYYPTKEN
ncbi:MAG: hypothetical protein HFI72_07470 [Peptococcaceae bacterium]|nr:hypothetical protein [Peptococcaceae bacterium]